MSKQMGNGCIKGEEYESSITKGSVDYNKVSNNYSSHTNSSGFRDLWRDPESVKTEEEMNEVVKECWEMIERRQRKTKRARQEPPRVVRVFVSSTFVDMDTERNILTQKVFPELRAWLKERGLALVETDLRWGVKKDTNETETITVCLKELEECPFFISILGERYGWIPKKDDLNEYLIDQGWIPNVSITHMEIFQAVLLSDNAEDAILFIRDPRCLEQVPPEHRERMIEKMPLAQEQLLELKYKLGKWYSHQVHDYSARFAGLDGRRVKFDIPADEFANVATYFLKTAIANRYDFDLNSKDYGQDPIENEEKVQSYYLDHQTYKFFIGRSRELKILREFMSKKSTINGTEKLQIEESTAKPITWERGNPIFFVSGQSGVGKESLLTKFSKELTCRKLMHFASASSDSTSSALLLKRLLQFSDISFPQNGGYDSYCRIFMEKGLDGLNRIGKEVVVVLDGLNKLDSEPSPRHLEWLPASFPPNVTCFVSCDSENMPTKYRIESRGPVKLKLEPFNREEQEQYVVEYLSRFGKELDPEQTTLLLSHHRSLDWLEFALEELRLFGDFRKLSDKIKKLPIGLPDLIREIIQRLVAWDDEEHLTEETLCLLVCSKDGILEKDMLPLLGNVFKRESVPPMVWSKTKVALGSLIRISANSTVLLAHQAVNQVVNTQLLRSDSKKRSFHEKLATFYDKICTDYRHVQRYLPFHLIEANRLREATLLLLQDKRALTMNPMEKQRWFTDIKCNAMITNSRGSADVYICTFCLNTTKASRQCFLCGMSGDLPARLCTQHSFSHQRQNKCIVCDKIIANESFGTKARLCKFCKGHGPDHCCYLPMKA